MTAAAWGPLPRPIHALKGNGARDGLLPNPASRGHLAAFLVEGCLLLPLSWSCSILIRWITDRAHLVHLQAQQTGALGRVAPLLQKKSTATILAAIEASRFSLMGRIDSLALECSLILNDMDKFRGRMMEAESRISVVDDVSNTSTRTIADLQRTVKMLTDRSEDAENRLRRNKVYPPLQKISLNKSYTLHRFPWPISWNVHTGCRLGLDRQKRLCGGFWLHFSTSGILSLLPDKIPSSIMRIPPFTCSLIPLQRFNVAGAFLWMSVNASRPT